MNVTAGLLERGDMGPCDINFDKRESLMYTAGSNRRLDEPRNHVAAAYRISAGNSLISNLFFLYHHCKLFILCDGIPIIKGVIQTRIKLLDFERPNMSTKL